MLKSSRHRAVAAPPATTFPAQAPAGHLPPPAPRDPLSPPVLGRELTRNANLPAGVYRFYVSIGEDRKTVLPRSPGIVRFGVCLGIGWVVSSRDIVLSPRSQGSRSGE
jgi:hypothetical protein